MSTAPAKRTAATGLPAHKLAGRRLGRYEVLTQLASGGMAGVYVARSQGVAGFERLVAVKVLHPHLAHEQEFITMFLDEARLAARIRHPNVVPTLDISDTEGAGFFLVMDYIEGDHLGALLRASVKRRERLPVPVVLRIVLDALSGLAAAHALTDERGERLELVHRDVSPHNILVGKDGIARLVDFGVAKAEVRLSSTREGQFKGKLSYMAPEHASNGVADQRSDLFSMGIVLWECLTGQRLFRGENNASTLNKILHDPIPRPSEVAPMLEPFDAVMERALARPPEERFQTADDLIEALERASTAFGGPATTRTVANEVRALVGDKLEEEDRRIREATELLTAQAAEGSLHPPAASLRPSDSAISMTRPATRSGETEVGGWARVWPWALLVLLLLGGATAFAWTLGLGGAPPEGTTADQGTAAPATAEPVEAADDPTITRVRYGEPPEADPEGGEASAPDPEGLTEEDREAAGARAASETAESSAEGAQPEAASDADRRRRALRRARARARQEQAVEGETQPSAEPEAGEEDRAPSRGGSAAREGSRSGEGDPADDLLSNPYRR